MTASTDDLLAAQIEYYRARALEYDEWFLRKGRYDQGAKLNRQWFAEIEQVRKTLQKSRPAGDILELACGTGLWTERLLPFAESLTAVDTSAEMIAINRDRLKSAAVEYIQANVFDWESQHRFDFIFFGFWLSHVPPESFESFWHTVGSALRRAGSVFFVDSLYSSTGTARDQHLRGRTDIKVHRRLNDGREFEIFKVFYEPQTLADRLATLGWNIKVSATERYFVYGHGSRQ